MDFNLKKEGITEPQANAVSNTQEESTLNPCINAPANDVLQFKISEYKNKFDNEPKPRVHTWTSFCEEFSNHPVRFAKDGPAWSPASYVDGGIRKNEFVEKVYFAVIDIDKGMPHDVLQERFSGYTYLIHSSFNHSPELEKYRMILPLSKPVEAAEWRHVWNRINEFAGGCNDLSTKDPARLYYKPAHPPRTSHHFVKVSEGKLLDISELPEVPLAPTRTYPITFHHKSSGGALPAIDGIESASHDLNFEQGLHEVVNRCAFMQFASTPDNQASISEPLWMAMITNVACFENSEAWVHSASEYHPGYSNVETASRIERYREKLVPITCQRIRELGFQNCPSGGCKRPNGNVTMAPAGMYGWMFRRQLTADQLNSAELPDSYPVGHRFLVTPHGVYRIVVDDGKEKHHKVCSRLDVVALTRDHESSNWGMEVQFTDSDNITKRWAFPTELLATSGESYRKSLLRQGFKIEPTEAGRAGLAAYLSDATPPARALAVTQPGWFNGQFVLPDSAFGPADQRVVFQTNDPDEIKRFSPNGSLGSWQQNVAVPCIGNSRAATSICIGLAPPLLALLGEDNGGFHLRGNSSTGKSVCLAVGSSVWGGQRLIRTWNMTTNGFEGVAMMHNDVLLPLDELGQADGKAAGEAAYMLGNGQGKSRANRDGEAKPAKRFRSLVLSSGEKSLSDMMAEAGKASMAGQEVRMVEIAADASRGYGIFENIHGERNSQAFAEKLKRATVENHGYAGRAFVEVLANPELQPTLVEKVKTLIQRFVDTNVPEGATGQVGRVARRFGLVAAAGELCIELGILPWHEGEAFDACRKCFTSWIDLRGGIGNHEAEQAIARVRRFIELYGDCRFTAWTEGIDNNGLGKTIQRAGFRRVTADEGTEYFVLPEVYKTEICAGLNPTYVTQILVEKGFLATDSKGKAQVDQRLPGIGKKRVYHLNAYFMRDAVSQDKKEETVGRQSNISEIAKKYSI
jgi:uncharacterized protein (DUF927 family)